MYTETDSENQYTSEGVNAILKNHGIEIQIGTDFDEYKRIVSAERAEQDIGMPFNPDKIALVSGECFWVIGRSTEGDLIHTQACKLLRMQNRSLAQYMTGEFKTFPPAVPDIDFKRSRFLATPASHRIKGKVAYHGEIWLTQKTGLYRGRGLTPLLARVGLIQMCRRWAPDFMFGLMARVLAEKGYSKKFGYIHSESGALQWYRDKSDLPIEGFLCYISRKDVAYLEATPEISL